MGQVIVDPRNFNPAIDLVAVRAVYSDKEVAFHLTWDDPTESKGDGKQTFADAIELQFPPQAAAGTERPYFLMGDANDAVYLLRWEQGKGVGEASGNGPAKVAALTGGEATGKAVFSNGQYRLVMKRPLAAQGRRTHELSAGAIHARGVPRVGRRSGGDRPEDVADLVVLSAAGGTAVESEIHHSSRRGTPHAGGHDPRRPCGESHAMTSRLIDGPTLSTLTIQEDNR